MSDISKELVDAVRAAKVVIDYASSIVWNGRPQAIAARPADVDLALRAFNDAIAKLPPPVDPDIEEARKMARPAIELIASEEILAADVYGLALDALKRGRELQKQESQS